jgi:hypothetical protein
MTAKFTIGRARKGFYELLKKLIPAEQQRNTMDALQGILFKDEASLLKLTDGPSDWDNGKYLQSTASGTQWASATGSYDPPRAQAYRSASAQSVTVGSAQNASFEATTWDTDSIWDTSGKVNFTIPEDGLYYVTMQVQVVGTDATNDQMRAFLVKNASTLATWSSENDIGAHMINLDGSNKWYWYTTGAYEGLFSASDVLKMQYYLFGGSTAANVNYAVLTVVQAVAT